MEEFVLLCYSLEKNTTSSDKQEIFLQYCLNAIDTDVLWAIALFSGNRPKRILLPSTLQTWVLDLTGISDWLFDESFRATGDVLETISLLPKLPTQKMTTTLTSMVMLIDGCRNLPEPELKLKILEVWQGLDVASRLIFNRLVCGSFRVKLPSAVIIGSLAALTGKTPAYLAHKLSLSWSPKNTTLDALFNCDESIRTFVSPFIFPEIVQTNLADLSSEDIDAWLIEPHRTNLRYQLVFTSDHRYLWSEEFEYSEASFGFIDHAHEKFPVNSILEGWLIAAETIPVPGKKPKPKQVFIASDMVMCKGQDLSHEPLSKRRNHLIELINSVNSDDLRLSGDLHFKSWEELHLYLNTNDSKQLPDGILLRRLSAHYLKDESTSHVHLTKNSRRFLGVLIYASVNQSRNHADLNEFTFAVYEEDILLPITKVNVQLSDEDQREIDAFIKSNTLEKFGPVRSVLPKQVFEIAFDRIELSKRHKRGFTLKNPVVLDWKKELLLHHVSQLSEVKEESNA